ncbi:hypothetical protein SNE40_002672 [Patella caerulea]|uniref:Uncharacterized protein n=1 Tax=Patella caerulea TaxID=87958 RepID=A0AAN8KCP0_PATCE
MYNIQVKILAVFLSLCLALLTDGAAITHPNLRLKRQTADVRTAEYLARMALGRALTSYGCRNIACGMVDVYRSGKKKRAEGNTVDEDDSNSYDFLRALIQRNIQENTN